MKIKFTLVLLFLLTTHLLQPTTVYAVCPVCTVAVGAGLGISRALGIDDAVTSVWIGGLILSMSYWLIDWLSKRKSAKIDKIKKATKSFYEPSIIALMYVLVLIPLWYGKYIGRFNNQFLGIDKILFGTAIGSTVFLLAKWADKKVREVKGKQLFIYQKVVFPVTSLIASSLLLTFLVS